MKVISFAAIKGGVGKTTLTFNFGEWLVEQGFKVLLIDTDHQCSLSQTYDVYDLDGTVKNIFDDQGELVKLHQIKKDLYLIAGSVDLDLINNAIQVKPNKELLMYMWMRDYYESKLKKFDYVLIDCHPDFSIVTQNMLVVSDYIFSPLEPSEYGFSSKSNLELRLDKLKKEAINVVTRETFVTAELKFIANRVKHNTKSSKEFLKVIEEYNDIIAVIPEKELFNRSTLDYEPIVIMEKNKLLKQRNQEFFVSINNIFNSLRLQIEKEKQE